MRRDLEWLLNSRRIADPPDEGLKEVNAPSTSMGFPISPLSPWPPTADRNRLVRQVLTTINLFEPPAYERAA